MTFTRTTITKLRELALGAELEDKILAIFEEAKLSKPAKKGDAVDRAARGTRLPADWKLPKSWGDYGLSQGLRENEIRREADKFLNYWTARAGAGGIKLDWPATWRTWIMKAADSLGRTAPADGPPRSALSAFTAETWQAIVANYERSGSWKPEYGPPPGSPGCRAPKDLGGLL